MVRVAFGDPVILHVVVLEPASPLIPTGTVILRDSRKTVAVGRLDNTGHVIFTLSSVVLGVGVHEMTVFYAGDQNFLPTLSNLLEVDIVVLNPTTTVLHASQSTPIFGTPITFTANVTSTSPGTITGTVVFFDGVDQIDSEPLSGGTATSIPISTLSVGTHAITAQYSGDLQFADSVSAPALIVTVIKTPPSIVLMSTLNPSNFGDSVTFTATLIPPHPGTVTGTVTFFDGVTPIGTSNVSSNTASITTSSLTGGAHSITATYNGDSNFGTVTSSPLTQTVNPLTTSTSLTSSINPTTYGQGTLLTATVTSSFGIPAGTVTFYNGSHIPGNIIGTGTLNNGATSITVATLPAGSDSLTAVYGGNSNYGSSTSNTVSQTVNMANTSTNLSSSSPSSPAGVNVTFTAVVTSAFAIPVGNVQFKDGGSNLGSPVALDGTGTAQFTTNSLSIGVHNITAIYAGNSNFNPSTSNTVPQTITGQVSTTNLIANANPINFGDSVMFTATVSGGAGTPTGTVQFMDASSPLNGPITLVSGSASFSTSSLAVGTHPITAVYSGSITYGPSTSNTVNEVVNKLNPTMTLTANFNPYTYGNVANPLFFTATLSGSQGVPTGTVQFIVDGVNTGNPVNINVGVSNGTANFQITTIPAGSHTISASYSGDNVYNTATANLNTNPEIINKADTTAVISSSVNPTSYGQSTTFSATVSSTTSGTPTGTVQFQDGGSNIGSPATLTGAIGSLAYSALTTGSHSITAVYSGDSNFNTSTSPALTQTVTKANSTTSLSSTTNPTVFGQTAMFIATVTGTAPLTGTVQFKDGGSNLGSPVSLSGTSSGSTATLNISSLSVAMHNITAVYNGDANNNVSTSNTVVQTVNKASTTITPFTASPPSGADLGTSITLQATVVPQISGIPSGTVTFFTVSPAHTLGTASVNNSNPDVATLSGVVFHSLGIAAGTYQLEATYNGDSSFTSSSAFINNYTVSKATPTISISESAASGQTTNITVTTSGSAGTVTGTITMVIDGTTTNLTGTLSGGTVMIAIPANYWGGHGNGDGGGPSHKGVHTIVASYGGDSSYNSGTSNQITFDYTLFTVTITTATEPSVVNGALPAPTSDWAIVVQVSGTHGTPTGTINLFANNQFTSTDFQLNTTTLTLNGSGQVTVTVSKSPHVGAENGPTIFADAATFHGATYTIQAHYFGNLIYDQLDGGAGTEHITDP